MRKQCVPYILPPAAVFVLLSAVFACYGLFPFGGNTLSWCDMNQQVLPLLMDWKDILEGKSSLFLNLQNAGGMNFWGVFLFFLSSPFSFLAVFVEKADFYYFANILVALKMGVCALTAAVFFRKRFPALNLAASTSLSVMYACCGYALSYYQNVVWLDVMYLFPLFLLALLHLAEKGRILPYLLALAAMLTVHFYLSYMLVLFLVLGSGVYLAFLPRKERGRPLVLLGVSTLSAGLLTGPVWLPSLLEYMGSARTGSLLDNLRIGSLITRLPTMLPVVFSTAAVASAAVLLLLYWRAAPSKIRACFFVFLLLLIPVFIEPINKMWHTGSYQAFPVRYGYITVFLGLILLAFLLSGQRGGEEGGRLRDAPVPLFLAMLSVALPFVSACILLYLKFEQITVYTRTLWGTEDSLKELGGFFLLAFLAYGILVLFLRERLLSRRAFSALLCVLLCVEAPFQLSVYLGSAASSGNAYSQVIDLAGRVEDEGLYRVKNEKKYFDVNLLGGLGYPTLNHYTSLTSRDYMFAMKKLGYSSYWMEVSSNGGTALTDALLGNRYTIFSLEDLPETAETVYRNGQYALAREELSLPFGFVFTPSDLQAAAELPGPAELSRMERQQWLFEALFGAGAGQLVKEYQPSYTENIQAVREEKWSLTPRLENGRAFFHYEIPVEGTQRLYFDCFDELHSYLYEEINGSFHVFVNGELVEQEYPSQSSNGLVDLGTYTDETVVVQVELLREASAYSFGVYGMDLELLQSTLSQVQGDGLQEAGGAVQGTFQGEEGQYLFVPIPNDGGISAYVNGEEAEVVRLFDCFFAVPLKEGENQVSLRYSPPGMGVGVLLGIGGVLLAALFVWLTRGGRYPASWRHLELPAKIVFSLLCSAVFLAVYVMPLAVFFLY